MDTVGIQKADELARRGVTPHVLTTTLTALGKNIPAKLHNGNHKPVANFKHKSTQNSNRATQRTAYRRLRGNLQKIGQLIAEGLNTKTYNPPEQ